MFYFLCNPHHTIKSIVKEYRQRAFVPLMVGIFLFMSIAPAQAIVIAPTFSVFGVVTDGESGEVLSDITVRIVTDVEDFDLTTDETGLYRSDDLSCTDSVMISVSQDGYEDYNQALSVPCYTSFEHNIVLHSAVATPEPVILVPGIMASWNRHLLDDNLEAADEWVLDPFFHTYDGLIDDLVQYGGYVLEESLFTFPYDWRQSNDFTANLLKGEIDRVKSLTGANKVDIVAHSMGGLVARDYIESDLYQDDIDQLIFIATPQRGAPKAYLAWEGGYLGSSIVSDFIKELLVARIAEHDGFCEELADRNACVYQYVREYPISSLQQLLPDYDYIFDIGGNNLRSYPTQYPRNEFLEELNSQAGLDKLATSGIEISTIYSANPASTIGQYQVVDQSAEQIPFWQYGYPDGFSTLNRREGIEFVHGDYTVPIESSKFINSESLIGKVGAKHLSIVNQSSKDIVEILKNEYVNITVVDQSDNYVIIQVHSPIDILVADPQGKRIGRDETISSDINEIPGAYYSGSAAGIEYMVLPAPEEGQYQLTTIGTDFGDFTVSVSQVDDSGYETDAISGTTEPGRFIDYEFTIDPTHEIEAVPTDVEPPLISIDSPHTGDYEHSDIVSIIYSASDNSGEVRFQSVLIDGEPYSTSSLDMFTLTLGEHTLSVSAGDWAGNDSQETIGFSVIATFASLRSDIVRLFSQGDIDRQMRHRLMRDVSHLQRWYTVYSRFLRNGHRDHTRLARMLDHITGQMVEKRLHRYLRKGRLTPEIFSLLSQQIEYIIRNQ